MNNNLLIKDKLLQSSLIAAQTLVFYLLIIMPLEYLLTEQLLIFKQIDSLSKTVVLLVIFVLTYIINYLLKSDFNANRLKFRCLVWPLLLVLTLGINYFYSRHYSYLQRYPRIYNLSSNWSIQGMKIRIDGKNFGRPDEPGQVLVDDFALMNLKWTNNEVVVEQPVPERYFAGELVLQKADGLSSQGWEFEIKDPAVLNQ